jgi:Zn-dependent protease/predicted transcriptional regulator
MAQPVPQDSMPGSLRIGRLFGIPIFVHASWLIIFGLVTWSLATGYFPARYPDISEQGAWLRSLAASLLFFASILLHELGHSLMAMRHGIEIRSITLFIFGGVARLAHDPENGRSEFKIAMAGPLVSVALGAFFYVASTVSLLSEAAQSVARYLAFINVAIAVFNLVPAFPLDGGRLLRGFVWTFAGKGRATRIAAGAGTAFAYLLIAGGLLTLFMGNGLAGVWYVLIGWFLREASAGAFREMRMDEALSGLSVGDAMTREVDALPADISLDEAVREHFLRTGFAGYPVRRGESVVGLVSLKDVMQQPADSRETTSVQAVMTPIDERFVVTPDEPLIEATAKLAENGMGRLLVMLEGRLVGLLTLGAVLRRAKLRDRLAHA